MNWGRFSSRLGKAESRDKPGLSIFHRNASSRNEERPALIFLYIKTKRRLVCLPLVP